MNTKGKTETWVEEFDKRWNFTGEKGTIWVVGERKPELIKAFISTVYQQGRAEAIEEVIEIIEKMKVAENVEALCDVIDALHQSTREVL